MLKMVLEANNDKVFITSSQIVTFELGDPV